MSTANYWLSIQIGDGKSIAAYRDGVFVEPVPADENCLGNRSTSLCNSNAKESFRHYYSKVKPIAVFVSSDGVEESFDQAGLYNFFYSVAYWLKEEGFDTAKAKVEGLLPQISEGGSGDDVSVAIMVSKEDAIVKPRQTLDQIYERVNACENAFGWDNFYKLYSAYTGAGALLPQGACGDIAYSFFSRIFYVYQHLNGAGPCASEHDKRAELLPGAGGAVFITAGVVMNYSGISTRLLKFADLVVGHLPGSLGHVNVLLSTLMGGISGSSNADAAMQCKILVPEMVKRGYSKEFSAAVTASSSLIPSIIPPGMVLLFYATVASSPWASCSWRATSPASCCAWP